MSASFLSTPLHTIKGVGKFYQKQLKSMGLVTFFDLLCHRPTHYQTYTINSLHKGHHCTVRARIQGHAQGRSPWIFPACTDKGQDLDLIFFRPLRFHPKPGSVVWIKGLVIHQRERFQIAHPYFCSMPRLDPKRCEISLPVYPLVKGLTSDKIAEWIRSILDQWSQEKYLIPMDQKLFTSWHGHLTEIHFPKGHAPCQGAVKAMAFDELMAMHLSFMQSKNAVKVMTHPCGPEGACLITHTLKQRMGYVLTDSQQQAWHDIQNDLSKEVPMMRLLNGDVGSGKTVIAFLAMARAVESGQQACLMAPTETLAQQHFHTLCSLLPEYDVDLITGRKKQKNQNTNPAFVVGTHALFYDKVSFHNLGLVVVDEQQRFGVMQRLRLSEKGHCPHMLFLSATPIPRTFQRVAYGDMDVSTLQKRPCALGTSSYVVSMDKIQDMVAWCQKVIQKKQCLYWVCPTIDHKDEGVVMRYTYWNNVFPGRVGLLHGRLSSQEKTEVMNAFRTGEKPFLISTTVIEVGVHVSQATSIFIENSSRFGLSQLHQLRGRVGRDALPGHCFFLYKSPITPIERQRLHCVKNCQDGFELARKDWKMRGAGTHMGTDQSGHRRTRFFCPNSHESLVEPARLQAQKMWDDGLRYPSFLSLFGQHDARVLNAG